MFSKFNEFINEKRANRFTDAIKMAKDKNCPPDFLENALAHAAALKYMWNAKDTTLDADDVKGLVELQGIVDKKHKKYNEFFTGHLPNIHPKVKDLILNYYGAKNLSSKL